MKKKYAKASIYIDEELLKKCDELKAKHSRSRNWIISKAIEEYVSKNNG